MEDCFMYQYGSYGTVYGFTVPKGGFFSRLKSDIYIAPGVKGLYFSGVHGLQMIISHELMHSFHWQLSIFENFDKSERATTAYTYLYGKVHGMTHWTDMTYRWNVNLDYPKIFSWRVFKGLNVFNIGL
jgi:hypothetical protein